MTDWADIFPQMEYYPTQDDRIFQTKFKRVSGEGLHAIKEKQYFACRTDGSCWGVTVTRESGVDPRKECEEAYFKVKEAVEYYELNGKWPDN